MQGSKSAHSISSSTTSGVAGLALKIRNLRRDLDVLEFLESLDELEFDGHYDYVYCPCDENYINRGYLIINMDTPAEALRLRSVVGQMDLAADESVGVVVSHNHIQGASENLQCLSAVLSRSGMPEIAGVWVLDEGMMRGLTSQEEIQEVLSKLQEARSSVASDSDCESSAAGTVFEQFVLKECNDGVTVVWHGLPGKWAIPDISAAFVDMGIEDCEYVYLPLKRFGKEHSFKHRNKGFAFLHFPSAEAAARFSVVCAEGPLPSSWTSAAEAQGISANLAQFRRWKKAYNTVLYIRVDGALQPVELSALQSLRNGC